MRCRALRELGQLVANGTTYDEIARAAGTTRMSVCRWFTGTRPRLAHRIRLRSRLGIAVIWWQTDTWLAKHGATPNIEAALAEAS
jgi:hypothetical protein